ncbi:ribonuclease R [Pseudoluteimonas lycopersici]|uniref:Ribonuclease R n=1 Tax=Pseudoluteimonas lycopersici TaxID=1324796 RepID=A0A516V436_9GAMM|nr:ribonuclease R [Lysobacter lycopersici]QDQ73247.1 ribonuclease R [Lysobacter lycopersici]
MSKPPGKRGGSRGNPPAKSKSPGKPAQGGRKPKPAATRPPWMPELPASPPSRGRPSAPPRTPPRSDPHAEREAQRYAQPIASREMILQILAASDGPMDADALARKLALTAPERFDALEKRLAAMLRDGQLLQNRRGGYVPAERADLVAGTVIANPDGFGFLRPDSGGGDDLFLSPFEMRKAMHGDRVLASVSGVDHRGRREGTIVEVLERRLSRLIGRYTEEAGIGYVVPDDKRIQRNVMIPADGCNDARNGQLVVAEITTPQDAHRPPIGRVLAVLGDKLTASQAVEAAIHGHDIPHEFSPEVLAQATAVPLDVQPADIAGRVDLRGVPLITIDGEDAKDFDDAVWCEPNKDGFRLIVAIADVSHYVRPGTALDDEAQLRATSVYFPGFVVPMLPETLSNGICSLNPKVDRLCFCCDMQVGRDGIVRESRFYEAVMHSHARLTYTDVWNGVGEGIPEDEHGAALAKIGSLLPQVQRLHQLYRLLDKARTKRGAIEFESGEVRFVLDAKGVVTQAGMLQRNDAHKLIEECMIAANVQAALFLLESGIPAPYRDHDKPPESKYADLEEFLKEFALRLPPWAKVKPKDFRALLEKIRERPDATLLESVILRSQSLAVYAPDNIGHFGLALEAYAHFTSPIRRYPDLLVHRAIKHALAGGKPGTYAYSPHAMASLSLQCSERSRRADEAQREVDERYRAAWMEGHVGKEFDGTISGVTSFGLFIELDESKVNGLVHVTQLPRDFYHFDAVRKTLTGERRGLEYRLGDRVRIVVLKASVEERKIDFRLVDDEGPAKPLPERGKPAKRVKQKY